MIVPVMATSNLVLTQQIYSEEPNGAHAHYREPVPLTQLRTTQPSYIGGATGGAGKNGGNLHAHVVRTTNSRTIG